MIADKKFRLFGKISIVDLFLIIMVVVIAFFAIRLSEIKDVVAASDTVPIEFTVELTHQDTGFYSHVKPGQKIYDNKKGYYIGELVAAEEVPYMGLASDMEAEAVRDYPVEGRSCLLVTVAADADISDEFILVNDVEISVGSEMFIRGSDFAGKGYCVVVNEEVSEQ